MYKNFSSLMTKLFAYILSEPFVSESIPFEIYLLTQFVETE